MNFPIYRKYSNNKVFFKIVSGEAFDEITLIGSKTVLQHIKATTYAEKLFIIDMIKVRKGNWEESDEKEFKKHL